MRGRVTSRDVGLGSIAAIAALAAMAAVAAAGLLLLDADRLGGLTALTAAVVILAAGGSVELEATASGLPVNLQGIVEVVPLGVSLIGALVLGTLLIRGGRVGLLVRGGTALAVVLAGIAAMALPARGTIAVQVPPIATDTGSTERSWLAGAGLGGSDAAVSALDIGFSVATAPALLAAGCWTVAVVAVCWLAVRVPSVALAMRAVTLSIGALTVALVAGAWVLWGPAAGGGLVLGSPLVLSAALLIGLGVPWMVRGEGTVVCLLDGAESTLGAGLLAPGGPLTWVALALLLGIGIIVGHATLAVRRPMRRALLVAAALAAVMSVVLSVLTLLTRISVDVGVTVFGFVQPMVGADLNADPWMAAGIGLVGGAVAGFAGSLLVSGMTTVASVEWRTWTDRFSR